MQQDDAWNTMDSLLDDCYTLLFNIETSYNKSRRYDEDYSMYRASMMKLKMNCFILKLNESDENLNDLGCLDIISNMYMKKRRNENDKHCFKLAMTSLRFLLDNYNGVPFFNNYI